MRKVGVWASGGLMAVVALGMASAGPCRAITADDLDRYKSGIAYQERSEWENAIRAFESIADRGDKAIEICIRVASCYDRLNMPRPAIDELNAGLSVVSGDTGKAKEFANQLATHYRQIKRFDDAVAVCNYLITIDSEHAVDYVNRIMECYYDKGDKNAVISACDGFIAKSPKTDVAKVAYARKAECYERMGDWGNAAQTYLAWGQEFPETAGSCVAQSARCHLKKGDKTTAVRQLKKRLAESPRDSASKKLYSALASAYFELGADADAVETIKKGLGTSVDDLAGNRELAQLLAKHYLKGDMVGEATSLYYGMIAMDPVHALSYRMDFGSCLLSYGDKNSAFTVVRDGLGHADKDAAWDAIVVFGDCVMVTNGLNDTMDFLTQVISDRPDMKKEIIERRVMIGQKFSRNIRKTIADYEELIRSFPESESVPAWTLEIASRTVFSLGNYKAGRQLHNEFLTKYPKDPRIIAAYHNLGMIDYLEKDYAAAVATFSQAMNCPEFGNYKALILFKLADCNKRLADEEKAKSSLDNLLGVYPDDCWSYRALDMFFPKKGGTQD